MTPNDLMRAYVYKQCCLLYGLASSGYLPQSVAREAERVPVPVSPLTRLKGIGEGPYAPPDETDCVGQGMTDAERMQNWRARKGNARRRAKHAHGRGT